MRETAKKFWQESKQYPAYGNIKQRRFYELDFILPYLNFHQTKKVLDLGCGDGALIKCLKELTDVESFYAYDFSAELMRGLLNIPGVFPSVYDCYEPEPLPEVDMTIMAGLIQYLDDEALDKLLSLVKSPVLIRTACSMEGKDIAIDKLSPKLGRQYASLYRTPHHTSDIISKHFTIKRMKYIYPPHLDSEFGTRQIYYYCVPKDE